MTADIDADHTRCERDCDVSPLDMSVTNRRDRLDFTAGVPVCFGGG
jgi:hypothetical protein